MIEDTLEECMEKGMYYKDIYLTAKERVNNFAKLVKPTTVISMEAVKILEEGNKNE